MKIENEIIKLEGAQLIDALCEIEYIMISLREMGRYYYQNVQSPPTDETYLEYALETTRFIDENLIFDRLNKVRAILSSPFNSELGDDDMDDIERAIETVKFWSKPGD